MIRQSAVKNVFIRGSVVRYVHLPANAVDVPLLEDATRRGTFHAWATKDYRPIGIPFALCLETNNVQRRRTRLGRGNERGIGKGALVMLRGQVLRGAACAQARNGAQRGAF